MDFFLVLIVVLVLAIVWRGPKTLPRLGAALGRGIREAKSEAAKAQTEIQARTTENDAPDTPTPAPAAPDAPGATPDDRTS